jgi:hypothetical protein
VDSVLGFSDRVSFQFDFEAVDKISKHVARAAKLKADDLKKVFAENLLAIMKRDR